jgi:hypothetical protein
MKANYHPNAIGGQEAEAVIRRVARYVRRHGSEYGEKPVPGGDIDEAVAVIVADWQLADWDAIELSYWERHGRLLFDPSHGDMAWHLRAVLFMAGRARKRGWATTSSDRRARRGEARRREMDDSPGAGMASRAADPARTVAAIEDAERGLRSVPDRFRRRRSRLVKTRNSSRVLLVVTRRPVATVDGGGRVRFGDGESTGIAFERVTIHNFRRVGDMANRDIPKTVNRPPANVTREAMREALVATPAAPVRVAVRPVPAPVPGGAMVRTLPYDVAGAEAVAEHNRAAAAAAGVPWAEIPAPRHFLPGYSDSRF